MLNLCHLLSPHYHLSILSSSDCHAPGSRDPNWLDASSPTQSRGFLLDFSSLSLPRIFRGRSSSSPGVVRHHHHPHAVVELCDFVLFYCFGRDVIARSEHPPIQSFFGRHLLFTVQSTWLDSICTRDHKTQSHSYITCIPVSSQNNLRWGHTGKLNFSWRLQLPKSSS